MYISINKEINKILYIVAFFWIVRPEYMTPIGIFNAIWNQDWVLYLLIAFFIYKYRELKNIGVWLLLLIFVWLGISTIINDSSIIAYKQAFQNVIVGILLSYYGIKYDRKAFLKSAIFVLGMYIAINAISMIMFPGGLTYEQAFFSNGVHEKSFFFGKNTAIKVMVPCLLFVSLYENSYENGIRWKSKILSLVILGESAFAQSGTSTIVALILVIGTWVSSDKIPETINILSAWALNILFFFGIIVFKMQYLFESFLVGVLNKDLTFSGRTPLWDSGIFYIISKPIIGYGIEDKVIAASKIGEGVRNDTMHNFIIDYLYQGGIVVIIIWTVVIIFLYTILRKYKNQEIRKIFNYCIFSMMIVWMTEPFSRGRILFSAMMFVTAMVYNFSDNDAEFRNYKVDNERQIH